MGNKLLYWDYKGPYNSGNKSLTLTPGSWALTIQILYWIVFPRLGRKSWCCDFCSPEKCFLRTSGIVINIISVRRPSSSLTLLIIIGPLSSSINPPDHHPLLSVVHCLLSVVHHCLLSIVCHCLLSVVHHPLFVVIRYLSSFMLIAVHCWSLSLLVVHCCHHWCQLSIGIIVSVAVSVVCQCYGVLFLSCSAGREAWGRCKETVMSVCTYLSSQGVHWQWCCPQLLSPLVLLEVLRCGACDADDAACTMQEVLSWETTATPSSSGHWRAETPTVARWWQPQHMIKHRTNWRSPSVLCVDVNC